MSTTWFDVPFPHFEPRNTQPHLHSRCRDILAQRREDRDPCAKTAGSAHDKENDIVIAIICNIQEDVADAMRHCKTQTQHAGVCKVG